MLLEALFADLAARVVEEDEARLSSAESDAAETELVEEESRFAEAVMKKMDELGLNQTELAQRIGISQPAISNILNRRCRPQRRTIEKFAHALHVSPSELWPNF